MRIFIILLLLLPKTLSSQIAIDKAGDNWDLFIDSSLKIIERIDPIRRKMIDSVCERITMWNGGFSSCEGQKDLKGTITVSDKDIKLGYDNVAAVLVHESMHLYFAKKGVILDLDAEEILCYKYELGYLLKYKRPVQFLVFHAVEQIDKRMIKK